MKLSNYTLPQQKAITEYGKNILVSAGAGSGKTQVLTERVMYFIHNHDYLLTDFLVLTFTNLASQEMKERIRKSLIDDNNINKELVEGASIQTFDSFALNIVKKYHQLIKVSKNIKIVDESLLQVKLRKILNDIFADLYESNNQEFLNLIDKYTFKNDDDIINLIIDIYNKCEGELDSLYYYQNYESIFYNEEIIDSYYDYFIKHLLDLRDELKEKIMLLPKVLLKRDSIDNYHDETLKIYNSFLNAIEYNELMDFLNLKPLRKPAKLDSSDSSLIDDFKETIDKINKFISDLPETKELFYLEFQENKESAHVLFKITSKLKEKIDEFKNDNQIYSFNDIAKFALKIVNDNNDVRLELKNKYKMIMIDEYQDTSLIQDMFISKIANNNVYMVGDIKQSIYRFRNARCDIFIDKYNKYKENPSLGMVIDLNTNFRSRKEVLYDINHIFSPLMKDDFGGANYQKYHMIDYGNKNYLINKEDINYHSTIYLYEKKKGKDNIITEAKIIASDIIDKINNKYQILDKKTNKLRDVRYSDFCILMDRGSYFDDYAKVLIEQSIPFFMERDEDVSHNTIFMLLSNLLRVIKGIINNDLNSLETKKAYLSLARSFVFNLDDQVIYEEYSNISNSLVIIKLKELINKHQENKLSDLVKNIIFDLDIYHLLITIGDVTKNEECLNLFISLLDDMNNLDYTIDDFINYLEDIEKYDLKITLTSSKIDIDSVKIMNIHKSKGLEFNIVYYPLLFKEFNRQIMRERFGFSPSFGLYLTKPSQTKMSLLKRLIINNEEKEEISERIRLFYVSLTRAKEQMIFVIPTEEGKPLYDKYQKLLNNEEINYPNKSMDYYLRKAIEVLNNKIIDVNTYKKLIKYFGYSFVSLTMVNNTTYYNKNDYSQDLAPRNDKYVITEAFNDCLSNIITINEFFYLIQIMDKYIPPFLLDMKLDNTIDIMDYIYDQSKFVLKEKCNSFYDFLITSLDYPIFSYKLTSNSLNYKKELPMSINKLDIVNFKYEKKEKTITKASKEISINTNANTMQYGTDLHFLFEVIDFIHPDYSFLSIDEASYIKDFLKSDLMKNIQYGKIYKEYEYIDEKNNIHGIIDLMVIYDDYIDIIDYKTKDIDDDNYKEQVTKYCNYIEKTFNKTTNGYLYSIFERKYLKV